MMRKALVLVLALLVAATGSVAYAQYDLYPADLRITLSPRPFGESQSYVSDPDQVYPMNPGQTLLPIAGETRPGMLRVVRVEFERTGIYRDVPVAPNGLFLLNLPLGALPPGVYRLLVNGFHAATIRIV